MRDTLAKLSAILDRRERFRILILLAMSLVMGLAELGSVAAILPFVSIFADPSVVTTNRYLAVLYDRLGFDDPKTFLVVIGALVFTLLIAVSGYKALTTWLTIRFTQSLQHSISSRLLSGYLNGPYASLLARNNVEIARALLFEVNQVVIRTIFPSLQVFSQGILVLVLLALMLVVAPLLALTCAVVLGGLYAAIFLFIKTKLRAMGLGRTNAFSERLKVVQETLGGIKEIKVMGLESIFLARFRNVSLNVVKGETAVQTFGLLPRYSLEALGLAGMLLFLVYIFSTHGDLKNGLPILAIYAVAGFRLLPAVQNLYQYATNLQFSRPAIDALHADIKASEAAAAPTRGPDVLPALARSIELRDVTFGHRAAERPILKNISLTIKAGTSVAFVGATGAGKSTIVDLVLGLLQPTCGQVLIDAVPLQRSNIRAWNRQIGYVPQHFFLADDTVAANVAFGSADGTIDMSAVERAARAASLHQFVTNELPLGYSTLVGERGVRLSGGQRQRIAIARALYRDPAVLILDEATNALDAATEGAVMDEIQRLGSGKTIIIVAHRLSMVRNCDRIFVIDDGVLAATGNYDELLSRSERFRSLAAV